MLQVWIDDSGTDQAPGLVLGGYVGRVQYWEAFADDWQDLLQNKKPVLEYIKGEEAHHRRRQFKEWTEVERDSRVLAFISLINKYRLTPVRSVIRHDDFNAVMAMKRGPFKTPEYYALAALFTHIISAAHLSRQRERLEFFFDVDVVKKSELKAAYSTLMRILPPNISDLIEGEPTFRDDKHFMPLQAADLYAWHVRRDAWERERGTRLDTPIWRALGAPEPIDCSFDRQDMEHMLSMMHNRQLRRLLVNKQK